MIVQDSGSRDAAFEAGLKVRGNSSRAIIPLHLWKESNHAQ